MQSNIRNVVHCGLIMMLLASAPAVGLAQEDTNKGKPTVSGQTKEAGKEAGKAGKSLGSNVKHGRIVRGGKHFGKHIGHSAKNVGSASKKVAKKTYRGVKKAVTP